MKIKKIYIIGASGSGKGWLAKKISSKLHIQSYDLDDIQWIKKYTDKRSDKNRIEKLNIITEKEFWIIEGIYGSWTQEAVGKADLIVWLNPLFIVLFWRILTRYLKNLKNSENSLIGTYQLIKYIIRYKKKYNNISSSYKIHFQMVEKNKFKSIIIENKRQFNKFLENLE